eukprot:1178298-Amphidinium_carterae.1
MAGFGGVHDSLCRSSGPTELELAAAGLHHTDNRIALFWNVQISFSDLCHMALNRSAAFWFQGLEVGGFCFGFDAPSSLLCVAKRKGGE